ncbi:MAG: hypothetical protein ACE5FR_01015 [Rhodospirillales bacterium]
MTSKWILAASVAALGIHVPWGAQAFECPRHLAAAEAAVNKVTGEMQKLKPVMDTMMDKTEMSVVHTLLANARILVAVARRSHEKPVGPYDHARAIAKADAARGYAEATEILHRHYYQKVVHSKAMRK